MKVHNGLLVVLLFAGAVFSALDPEKDPIQVKSVSGKYNKALSTLKIECQLSIPEPWHVNSDSLAQDYLIPTGVVLADSTLGKRVKKSYPKPVLRTVFGQELSLFEGELEFSNYFYMNKPPVFPVEIVLQYQSCSDKICLPPVFKKISLSEQNGLIKAKY